MRSKPSLSAIVATLAQKGKQERILDLHVSTTVQKLMGHKDIETTMNYVHVEVGFDSRLQSPVDRLLQG
ncbi:hypothetical protein [Neorhodopirellula pilleata]|nr:hypothetical protein [Neorhodopirellula pilleata]